MHLASRSVCAAFVAVLLFSLTACKQQAPTYESANAARTAASAAYIYGYPLVLMDVTRRSQCTFHTRRIRVRRPRTSSAT